MGGEVVVVEQPPSRRQPGLAIAGHQQQDGPPFVVHHRQALHQVGGGHLPLLAGPAVPGGGKERHHRLDPGAVGGVVVDQCRAVSSGAARRWIGVHSPLGRLHVGGVPAGGALDEVVLSHHRRHHELVVHVTADGPGAGLDRKDLQVEAPEDPEIRLEDRGIGALHGLLVDIEGVGVGHDQLPGAQQAEPGAGLVTELHLDLVEGERELPVGVDLGADGDGGHLLVGRAEDEASAPSLDHHGRQGLGPEHGRPPTLLPQLERVEDGHQHLLPTGGVQLLADDRFDVLQHPQAEG